MKTRPSETKDRDLDGPDRQLDDPKIAKRRWGFFMDNVMPFSKHVRPHCHGAVTDLGKSAQLL